MYVIVPPIKRAAAFNKLDIILLIDVRNSTARSLSIIKIIGLKLFLVGLHVYKPMHA